MAKVVSAKVVSKPNSIGRFRSHVSRFGPDSDVTDAVCFWSTLAPIWPISASGWPRAATYLFSNLLDNLGARRPCRVVWRATFGTQLSGNLLLFAIIGRSRTAGSCGRYLAHGRGGPSGGPQRSPGVGAGARAWGRRVRGAGGACACGRLRSVGREARARCRGTGFGGGHHVLGPDGKGARLAFVAGALRRWPSRSSLRPGGPLPSGAACGARLDPRARARHSWRGREGVNRAAPSPPKSGGAVGPSCS